MTDSILKADFLADLVKFKQIYLGFSGGLDSTVLLHALSRQENLRNKLKAVHINHGLSANAEAWQAHCQMICSEWEIPFISQAAVFPKEANVEEEARKARYTIFASILNAEDCLVLGHHLDDQGETLLLQLFRGAGVDGLAAMRAQKRFVKGILLRPLLAYNRSQLEAYARLKKLSWIEDESNQNLDFSRNYLRHEIIPQLQNRWPSLTKKLARAAEHCQAAIANLEALAKLDCPSLEQATISLTLDSWVNLDAARVDNVLRFWFKKNSIKPPNTATFKRLHQEVLNAAEGANPVIVLDDRVLRRYKKILYLSTLKTERFSSVDWINFPANLNLSAGSLQVKTAQKGLTIPEHCRLSVKFRQGGETIRWRGQTKSLKKLFQAWQIPPWLRDEIPLLYVNDQLVAVIGFAISDNFYSAQGHCYEISNVGWALQPNLHQFNTPDD